MDFLGRDIGKMLSYQMINTIYIPTWKNHIKITFDNMTYNGINLYY